MADQQTVLNAVKQKVGKRRTESGERNAVAAVLAKYGWVGEPSQVGQGAAEDGRRIRIYLWEGTPAGDFALVTGPSADGEIITAAELAAEQAAAGKILVSVGAPPAKYERQALGGIARAAARGAREQPSVRTTRKPRSMPPGKPVKAPRRGMEYTTPSRPVPWSPRRPVVPPADIYAPVAVEEVEEVEEVPAPAPAPEFSKEETAELMGQFRELLKAAL